MTPAVSASGIGCICPVCEQQETEVFITLSGRDYWRSAVCEARFLDPAARLDARAEHACYLHHQNDIHDPAYRRFVSKLAEPLSARLPVPSEGLDYGCGPGPVLGAILSEQGHRIAYYDPFFASDPAVLERSYDFVICSEVAEHFHHPASEFRRLGALLRPGGWLGIMTCFQTDDERFATWHYTKDPTHVVFYREATLHWLAGSAGWRCTIPCKDVALMQRPGLRPQ
jgi:SAM-dependent methyltransferase